MFVKACRFCLVPLLMYCLTISSSPVITPTLTVMMLFLCVVKVRSHSRVHSVVNVYGGSLT